MNTQYPLRAKHNHSDLVVEFVSECEGTVVVPSPYYEIGYYSKGWQTCTDHYRWTILAAEPASEENKPENNNIMNNNTNNVTGGFSRLPEKWFIRTLDPALSAAIQKQLFKLGYKWRNGRDEPSFLNESAVLRGYEDKTFARHATEENFNRAKENYPSTNDLVEITIEQLFSLSPAKEISFEIAGYKGAATAETIKVGCQEMTTANYKEMKAEIEEYRKPKPDKNLSNKFKDSRTEVVISPRGISFASTEFGVCHLQYKEFDELDKTLNRG